MERKILKQIFQRIEYGGVLLCYGFAHLFPMDIATKMAEGIGAVAFWVLRKRRKVAIENITRAFGDRLSDPEKEILARRSFESAAVSILELFVAGRTRKYYQHLFHIRGLDHIDRAVKEGKGIVLAIAHLGAWEYMAFLGLFMAPMRYVVVKNFKNPHVTKLINRLREKIPVVPIPKDNAIRTMLKELKNNQLIAILMDQWSGPDGLWVPFFGQETSTTSLPARLAERHGAALIMASCMRMGSGRYEVYIEEPMAIDSSDPNWEYQTTLKLNQLLERKIREAPSQWLWGHRRWKPRPAEGTASLTKPQ